MTSSYVPEDGDEVEVVLRGKVSEHYRGGFCVAADDRGYFIDTANPHVVSVTKVTPALPTTLDSKVDATDRDGLRGEWVLIRRADRGGWWRLLDTVVSVPGNLLTVHSVLRVGGAA